MFKNNRKLVLLMSLLVSGAANAGLIGDNVRVAHNYDNFGEEYSAEGFIPTNVNVVNGTADQVNWNYYSVNVDDSFIFVDFLTSATWTNSSFNGLVVSAISSILTGYSVSTNLAGWTNARFTNTSNLVALNFAGLTFGTDSFLRLSFDGTPQPRVPEPAALGLLAMGLLGVGLSRRRKASVAA
jgi:hypothetical protein